MALHKGAMGFTVRKGSEKGSQKGFFEGGCQKGFLESEGA